MDDIAVIERRVGGCIIEPDRKKRAIAKRTKRWIFRDEPIDRHGKRCGSFEIERNSRFADKRFGRSKKLNGNMHRVLCDLSNRNIVLKHSPPWCVIDCFVAPRNDGNPQNPIINPMNP